MCAAQEMETRSIRAEMVSHNALIKGLKVVRQLVVAELTCMGLSVFCPPTSPESHNGPTQPLLWVYMSLSLPA